MLIYYKVIRTFLVSISIKIHAVLSVKFNSFSKPAFTLYFTHQQKSPSICIERLILYQGRESNPHELLAHKILSLACLPVPPPRPLTSVSYLIKKHRYRCFFRAKDGVRTRDLDLGKVALYQLSYFRVFVIATPCYCVLMMQM